VLPAARAELLKLNAIWVVTTVLLGDVVALFALATGKSDFRSNVGSLAHGSAFR
jgi:hypothetical protein